MDTVRAFIAVDIGDEIRQKLDELQRRLKKVHANVRWVNPHNIHLTLVFMGDLATDQIDAIKKQIDCSCEQQEPFELEACGTGFFGRSGHPRVIWAGVTDCPPLTALQSRIVQGLHNAGFEFDTKPFSPHLTLGRVKGIDRHTGPLLEKIEKYRQAELGSTQIDRVDLIQSRLTPRGPEYEVMHWVNLLKRSASSASGGNGTPPAREQYAMGSGNKQPRSLIAEAGSRAPSLHAYQPGNFYKNARKATRTSPCSSPSDRVRPTGTLHKRGRVEC